ncbi:hypothetical protein ABPG74_002061 [Tetrahymena malaccensis]
MDAFSNFMDILGELREQPLNMKELKNEFKLPKKNFPKISKMIHYFKTEFSTRTRNESRTKWHNYDKQLLFWVVCKYCQLNQKYIVASLSKKGQKSMDDNDWVHISAILGVETKILKNKWLVMVKPQVKNAPWTQEEDSILKSLIDPSEKNHNWTQVATKLAELTQNSSFRNAKQIRERWNNYLNPTLKKSEWEESEDVLLLESVLSQGKKWSQISQIMGCRTESQVKNRYNSISNRLKKTYGEQYPEETLIQMEISQLKGYTSSSQSTNFATHKLIVPSNNIKIKKEMVSPLMSAVPSNDMLAKKNNSLNSSDTLQVNLRRHKSSADSIITEQNHQSPAYSSSSPQLSETSYQQDATSIIQLDMNTVAKQEMVNSNQVLSQQSSSTVATPQHSHHFQIPQLPAFISHPQAYKQDMQPVFNQNVQEVPEFNTQNHLQFQEPVQPQYITLNYQQYQAVHGQETQQQQQQQSSSQQIQTQPANIPPSISYFYDNYFQVNTPTPANQNNNGSGNLYMEDWGFTQMHQTYNAPTPNNHQAHPYYNNTNTTTNQYATSGAGNLDFNTAFHGLEQNEFFARRNSALMNDSQRHQNYQPTHHHPNNFFTIPTTPQNQANAAQSFYYEEQY